jgi:hypothetical protein
MKSIRMKMPPKGLETKRGSRNADCGKWKGSPTTLSTRTGMKKMSLKRLRICSKTKEGRVLASKRLQLDYRRSTSILLRRLILFGRS